MLQHSGSWNEPDSEYEITRHKEKTWEVEVCEPIVRMAYIQDQNWWLAVNEAMFESDRVREAR